MPTICNGGGDRERARKTTASALAETASDTREAGRAREAGEGEGERQGDKQGNNLPQRPQAAIGRAFLPIPMDASLHEVTGEGRECGSVFYLTPEAVAHLADLLEEAASCDKHSQADLWRDLARRLDDLAVAFPGQYRLYGRKSAGLDTLTDEQVRSWYDAGYRDD